MLSIYWIDIDKTTDYLWRTGNDFQLLEVDWNASRKGDFDDLKRQSYELLPTEKKLDSPGECAQNRCKFTDAKVIKTVADMMADYDRNIIQRSIWLKLHKYSPTLTLISIPILQRIFYGNFDYLVIFLLLIVMFLTMRN